MKKFASIAAGLALMTAACSAVTPTANYTVDATIGDSMDGQAAYIIDYDTNAPIDSTVVTGGVAAFRGQIGEPRMVRLIVNGDRLGSFILEQGAIKVANKEASGTQLNAKMDALDKQLSALEAKYHETPADATEEREAIIAQYDGLLDKMMEQNLDNPIGYYLFLQKGMELTLPELEAAVASHPSLADYKRVQKLVDSARKKEMTSVGHQMVDFEINSPDGTHKLSDYVGNGKYVLVDFWASWCGPCRKEIKTIKKILNDLGHDKLDVLGVAVWDEPENTLEAIEKLDITWPQIVNAQSIPTDLYGIAGIPCIILFDPDGKIVVRDKQGSDLEAAVKAEINNSAKED